MNKSAEGLLLLLEAMLDAIFREKSIYQLIVEKISRILNVERCVVFLIYPDSHGEQGVLCEIIAGTPEGEHGIGDVRSIDKHDDLVVVLEKGCIINNTNPEQNKNTKYFIETITRKKISNILYIPIILKSGRMVGIIVVDALEGRKFNDEEIEFCYYAGRLISAIINEGEQFIGRMRDLFFNRIVSVGGNLSRLKKFLGKIDESLDIFINDVKRMEKEFPKSILNNHGSSKEGK
jgi:signal transduction protein with GAF and PtsI domain